MAHKVFCGIEGGASVSKLVIVDSLANTLCSLEGPSCNYLLLGIEETQKRLVDMIVKAKEKAGLDASFSLDGVGLCMSGCEQEEANKEFEKSFMRKHPDMMKSCTVASDTIGPIYTVSPKGGLVLIAGTGSNSLLVNPDGSTARCGGWGHLLGDEASAMWISLKAVKTVFDHEDNLVKSKFDITRVKELIFQHFKVVDKFGILEHCYTTFDKTSFAGLCRKLAEAATKEKDALCCHLFFEAGKVLAQMVVALKPKVHEELLESEEGLPVICVGSVFKSWHLLEKGFHKGLGNHYKRLTLKVLNCSAAIGAVYLGAKAAGVNLPIDHSRNASILHVFSHYFI